MARRYYCDRFVVPVTSAKLQAMVTRVTAFGEQVTKGRALARRHTLVLLCAHGHKEGDGRRRMGG